jgi:hypothetical protein
MTTVRWQLAATILITPGRYFLISEMISRDPFRKAASMTYNPAKLNEGNVSEQYSLTISIASRIGNYHSSYFSFLKKL